MTILVTTNNINEETKSAVIESIKAFFIENNLSTSMGYKEFKSVWNEDGLKGVVHGVIKQHYMQRYDVEIDFGQDDAFVLLNYYLK